MFTMQKSEKEHNAQRMRNAFPRMKEMPDFKDHKRNFALQFFTEIAWFAPCTMVNDSYFIHVRRLVLKMNEISFPTIYTIFQFENYSSAMQCMFASLKSTTVLLNLK